MTGHILYPIMPTSVIPGLRDLEAEMPLTFLPIGRTIGKRERGQGTRDKGEGRERKTRRGKERGGREGGRRK